MGRFFFIFFLSLFAFLVLPSRASAVRYTQCDACGLCKDTTKSTAQTIYIQPARWNECFNCLYPALVNTPTPGGPGAPTPTAVPCLPDEASHHVVFQNIQNTPIPFQTSRCDTIIMNPTPNVNTPQNTPQSGRMFTDLGCISVNTAGGAFTDPNASVDIIQILLKLIINITGGVGMILIMVAGVRLIISRGNPEKIRGAKKTFTNVILGVLFALFALFIFQFLAVQVLRIPGFN